MPNPNAEWWYAIYFKIDFILHLTFERWHFSTFWNGAFSGTAGFSFYLQWPCVFVVEALIIVSIMR